MLKYKITIMVFFINFSTFAGDSLHQNTRFSIDINMSIGVAYRFVKEGDKLPNGTYYVPEYAIQNNAYPINYYISKQTKTIGFYIGPELTCRLYKNLKIHTGFKIDKLGYNAKLKDTLHGNHPYTYEGDFSADFYLIGLSAGLSEGFVLNKKTMAIITLRYSWNPAKFQQESDDAAGDGWNSNVINGSIGLLFNLKNRNQISICPNFNYATKPIYFLVKFSEYKKVNLYSYGIELGYHFGIKERKRKEK